MDELIPLVGAQHGTFFIAGTPARARSCACAGYGLGRHRCAQPLPAGPVADRPGGQDQEAHPCHRRATRLRTDLLGAGRRRAGQPHGAAHRVRGAGPGRHRGRSFSRFTQVHQDFLEQLMETIGINVNTIIVNSRTDHLLQESQRLAAELQSSTGELQARQENCRGPTPSWRTRRCSWPGRSRHEIKTPRSSTPGRRSRSARGSWTWRPGTSPSSANISHGAHPAEQPAHPSPAAGREPGREPQRQAGRVRERDPLVRVGPALADQRHPGSVPGGGKQLDVHPERSPGSLAEDLRTVFEPLAAESGWIS